MTSTLRGTSGPLADQHDVALLDLDGVVYIGAEAVPGAPSALSTAADRGLRLAYVTNNAARPPEAVASHLSELGIPATSADVITSAQAAARFLGEHLPDGATVLVLGTTGLYEALAEQGLDATDTATDDVAAVVQGYSPEMSWRLLAEGSVAINAGALWVATNIDPTVPSPRGPLPGNGSLVAALRHATHKVPVVTGKPDPTMHRETLIRTGARQPIVVGDRLDTDIEGANAVGCPSLLVFSGVTDAAELLLAEPRHRPTYIGADVSALLDVHPEPESSTDGARCGRWQATASDGGLQLEIDRTAPDPAHRTSDQLTDGGPPSLDARFGPDRLDAIRALCAAWWSYATGPAQPSVIRGVDDASTTVLASLRLGSD